MQQNPEYKSIQQLLIHGQQLEGINPIFGYVTKAYATQKLHAFYKKSQSQELMKQLQQLISELEVSKNKYPQIANKDENKKLYTDFVYKFFLDADTRERNGEVSQELMQMFGAIQKAFEVLQYFEPLNQDQIEKQKYAKFKMVDQYKKIKDPSLIKPKEVDPIEAELEQIASNVNKNNNNNNNNTAEQIKSQRQQILKINETPQTQPQAQPQVISNNMPPVKQNQNTQQNQIPQQNTQQLPSNQIQQQNQPIPQKQTQQNQVTQNTVKLNPMEQAQMRNQVKSILQQSISEIDFKKYQNAKDQLQKVIEMLQQLQQSQ